MTFFAVGAHDPDTGVLDKSECPQHCERALVQLKPRHGERNAAQSSEPRNR